MWEKDKNYGDYSSELLWEKIRQYGLDKRGWGYTQKKDHNDALSVISDLSDDEMEKLAENLLNDNKFVEAMRKVKLRKLEE